VADILHNDLTFLHPPRISPALFAAIIVRNGSPAALEANVLATIPPIYGLDPAIALAFFHRESTYGTAGSALATRNWGNLRRGQGRSVGILNGFATYRTWADSLHDWCNLIRAHYITDLRLVTVRPALQVYAPSSDGNTPKRYADAVMADVARWQAEDTDTRGTHYRVRQGVTSGAKVRAAARQNGAVLDMLKAGADFYGESVVGQQIFLTGFGRSNLWVRSAAHTYVWSGLLEKVA